MMNSESENNWLCLKKRYVGLDIFRVVSVFAICAFHTTIHLGANYGPLQSMSRMGAVFMTAFFMLSGYSLFVNYAHENVIDLPNLKTFFLKRIIGVIPMYYVASVLFILFYYTAYKVFGFGKYSIIDELILAPVEILGIQSNFHTIFGYSHNGGTWFISCILMCYLIYPLLQEIAKQISNKAKILIILLFCFILLYAPFVQWKFNTVKIYANPFFRILEFSIGVILASMKPWLDGKRIINKYFYNWISIILVDILMIAGVSAAVHFGISVGNYMLYSWICLPCFIFMIVGLSGIQSEKLVKTKFIRYCSDIGYVFFLAQLYSNKICQFLISRLGIKNNIAIIVLGWLVCIVISAILHVAFEKPIKKILKRKLLKSNK